MTGALLFAAHLIGLSLAVGSATSKLVLLARCRADVGFAPTFLDASRPITRLIVLGVIVLTVSGVAWLFLGYGFTPRLCGTRWTACSPTSGFDAAFMYMDRGHRCVWVELPEGPFCADLRYAAPITGQRVPRRSRDSPRSSCAG